MIENRIRLWSPLFWNVAQGTWFQYFVIYWSQLQEFFLDILNMWPLHLPQKSGTNYQSCVATSDCYVAAKANNWKRFSVYSYGPLNSSQISCPKCYNHENQLVNLTNANVNLCPHGVVARPM